MRRCDTIPQRADQEDFLPLVGKHSIGRVLSVGNLAKYPRGEFYMRLLTLCPSPIRGGCEDYALTIATAAAKCGWDVHAAFPNLEGTSTLVRDFEQRGIKYHPLNFMEPWDSGSGWRKARFYWMRFIRPLLLLIQNQPSVVHIALPWPEY